MNNFKFLNHKLKYSFLLYLVLTTLLISCGENKPHQETEVKPTKEMLAHIIKTEKAVEIYKNDIYTNHCNGIKVVK